MFFALLGVIRCLSPWCSFGLGCLEFISVNQSKVLTRDVYSSFLMLVMFYKAQYGMSAASNALDLFVKGHAVTLVSGHVETSTRELCIVKLVRMWDDELKADMQYKKRFGV
jgi:hypothetical protein